MKKEIVCFGDSNTHGYNLDCGRFSDEIRWPGVLAGLLGKGYHVIEEGLVGRTTVFDDPIHENMNGLSMLSPIMLTHMPIDTLIIMLGTNDTKERFGASPIVIGIGMQRLVEKAQAVAEAWRSEARDIIIVAPAPIRKEIYEINGGGAMGRGCSEKSYGLAEEYRKVAELMHCRFLDAAPITQVDSADWMHLSAEGHSGLAKALAEMVR